MSRVVAPEVSEFYDKVHTDAGVVIKTGMAVTGFEGHGKVERVLCADDSSYPADLVVIGGNPAATISDIRKVETVFKQGIGYDPVKLIASVTGKAGLW